MPIFIHFGAPETILSGATKSLCNQSWQLPASRGCVTLPCNAVQEIVPESARLCNKITNALKTTVPKTAMCSFNKLAACVRRVVKLISSWFRKRPAEAPSEPLVLKHRLIAFLDVLGFEARMAEESPEELVRQYSKFLDEANGTIFNPTTTTVDGAQGPTSNFACTKFVFDSIVLVSHPVEDGASVSNFILATGLLMERGFLQRLPLRGAIALGDYVENTARGIFVSPAFKTLFQEEQASQWTGCCVLENAENIVVQATIGATASPASAFRHNPLISYPVPMRKRPDEADKSPVRWCINWRHMLSDEEFEKAEGYLIEPKRTNTRQFSEHVVGLPGVGIQPIPDTVPPLYLACMPISRTQARVSFFDAMGNRTRPTQPVTVGFGYPAPDNQ